VDPQLINQRLEELTKELDRIESEINSLIGTPLTYEVESQIASYSYQIEHLLNDVIAIFSTM
jgi:hypothetical protein